MMKRRPFSNLLAVCTVFTASFLFFSQALARSDMQEVAVIESDLDIREAPNLSLEDCIEMALKRNESLRAAGYEIEAAEARVTEAKAAFWPVLEYTYRIAPVPTDVDSAFSKFFEGQVTLFNGIHIGVGVPVTAFGKLHTAKRMAEGGVEAARLGEVKAREATILQVKKLYYGILLAKETIKLLQDAINKINNKLNEEERKEEPEMDPYDILQMKVFRTDLEGRLEEAHHNLDLAYGGLRIQLGLEPDTQVGLDTDDLRPVLASMGPEGAYIEASRETQPDVKLLDIGVETKRRQYRLEKYNLMPQAGIGFFADVGRTTGSVSGLQLTDDFNDPFDYTRAGLGLQLKGTIDFHGAYAKIKRARAEYYKVARERVIARRALELDVRKAYLSAKRTQENVRRAKKAESLARQMMFLSKLNMDTGIGEKEKYADALKLVLLTRGQYFKSVFDFNVALGGMAEKVGVAKHEELTGPMDEDYYDVTDEIGDEFKEFDREERYDEQPEGFDEDVKDEEKVE